jgi:Kinesin-associated
VAGSTGEDVYDPKIPPEKQKVTYKAKDGTLKTVTKAELQDQLESSEKLMQSLNETWEEKLQRTQEVQKEREKALEELGITVEKNNVGVHTPKKVHISSYKGWSSSLTDPDARCHTLSTWYVILFSRANGKIFIILQNEGEFLVGVVMWYSLCDRSTHE